MGKVTRTLIGGLIAAGALAAAAQATADAGDERKLRQSCERGERSACITLGTVLAEPYSPSEDRPRAIALLQPACDEPQSFGEMAELCAMVGKMLLVERTLDPERIDPARVDAYLARACDAGSRAICATLAAELESGELIAPDAARARQLRERLCRGGEQESCDALDPASALAEAPEDDDGRTMVRVINGDPVQRTSATWMAVIWRPEIGADGNRIPFSGRLACGGSVIAPGWILTAAHCIRDVAGFVSASSGHKIRLGVYDPFNPDEGSTHDIRQVIRHPSYKEPEESKALAWDIALIRYNVDAARRGRQRGRIAPLAVDTVPISQRVIASGTLATVFGWGRTTPGVQTTSRSLREGTVQLKGLQSCTAATSFTDTRRDSVLCARGRRGQHNCQGDSGGPLVLDAVPGRQPVLLGVISGSVSCGQIEQPSRFVRVTHHAVWSWLRQNLPADAWRRVTAARQ